MGWGMNQTPVHEQHNHDLLKLIPPSVCKLIEIGCSSGALAREIKQNNPGCNCIGIDIDPEYAKLAGRYCDHAFAEDIEQVGDDFFSGNSDRDCWVFGDSLEHLRDPWQLLSKIRKVIPAHGCVVACIPNAQHWSVLARLSIGAFRYENSGLLDRTHLRWFTRQTIVELFHASGFEIMEGVPRIFHEPQREPFLGVIGELAKLCGADPEVAVNDSLPLQYVIRAEPR